jgi:hypothetical protein
LAAEQYLRHPDFMNETLWTLPVPPTGLTKGPAFAALPKRQCELSFHIEGEGGGEKRVALMFEDVEAYKCTYMTSMKVEMINTAYGKLVKLGMTPWLAEVSERYKDYYRAARQPQKELQHLMICFDDGPCYEFICAGFRPL